MIKIAILGFGVVGSGTAEVLTENKAIIERKVGQPFDIKYILDLRDFPDSPFADKVIHDFKIIVDDPEVSLVAEMMGGSHPAYDFTKACLEAGKSVVTSNKEVVANFGTELLAIAKAHGVSYEFEASVGGGIPIIRPMNQDLSSNNITAVNGILNGTTNYILTKMETEGTPFAEVLKDAQKKGYAEANPTADVEGLDAARKIVILAAMAFGKRIDPNTIPCEGITKITVEDMETARELGYAIKLIGHTEKKDGKILCMVSPRLVSQYTPLSGVSDVFNGILVDADMVGQVMFYGPGAGKLPTASAVVADMIDIMEHTPANIKAPLWTDAASEDVMDFGTYTCKNLVVLDAPLSAADELSSVFGAKQFHGRNGRLAMITDALSEDAMNELLSKVGETYPVITRIRLL
ncbi:MAG: homoserine dehydrogenase [Ruminococcaceae bacterium]|nr:homoserine dehydrogenase [Oscillospiraceae bacterium]